MFRVSVSIAPPHRKKALFAKYRNNGIHYTVSADAAHSRFRQRAELFPYECYEVSGSSGMGHLHQDTGKYGLFQYLSMSPAGRPEFLRCAAAMLQEVAGWTALLYERKMRRQNVISSRQFVYGQGNRAWSSLIERQK